MLVQKMKCPYGCESATFLESVKTVAKSGGNLLLDSQQPNELTKNVKIYTCNCCHNSFETTPKNDSGKILL